jgi:hypothetical protein
MLQLIKDGKAPHGACCPSKIEAKALFALDVDDEIWQDVGLDDDVPGTEPPPWLANNDVRDGIKALLERDRCLEEEARLQHECRSMQEWFSEEWRIIDLLLTATSE